MYSSTGVGKLSESQKSKLRNGHPVRMKQGDGFFGDIASKAKAFAISTVKKNGDLINPIIGRARSYSKSGIQKLADKANEKVDYFTPEIEGEGVKRRRGRPKKGEGIIGDALKGLIGMSGLGVVKPKRLQKGKGVMSSLLKAVAPAIIDAASNAAKGKVQGMGATKRKAGRPRKGRGGGALFPAGTYGPGD